MDNGATLRTNYEVTAIVRAEDGFRICSADGRQVTAKYLINCAGCYADKIAELLGDKFFEIIPRAAVRFALILTVKNQQFRATAVQRAGNTESRNVSTRPAW